MTEYTTVALDKEAALALQTIKDETRLSKVEIVKMALTHFQATKVPEIVKSLTPTTPLPQQQ